MSSAEREEAVKQARSASEMGASAEHKRSSPLALSHYRHLRALHPP